MVSLDSMNDSNNATLSILLKITNMLAIVWTKWQQIRENTSL